MAGGLTAPSFIHKSCKARSDSTYCVGSGGPGAFLQPPDTNPTSSLCCKTLPFQPLLPPPFFPASPFSSQSPGFCRLPISHSWAPGRLSVVTWVYRAFFLQSLCPTLAASSSCCSSPSSPRTGRRGRPAEGPHSTVEPEPHLYLRKVAPPHSPASRLPLDLWGIGLICGLFVLIDLWESGSETSIKTISIELGEISLNNQMTQRPELVLATSKLDIPKCHLERQKGVCKECG